MFTKGYILLLSLLNVFVITCICDISMHIIEHCFTRGVLIFSDIFKFWYSFIFGIPYYSGEGGYQLHSYLFSDVESAGVFECSICLSTLENEELVIQLKCNNRHIFHTKCLEEWLKHQEKCPLCRSEIY